MKTRNFLATTLSFFFSVQSFGEPVVGHLSPSIEFSDYIGKKITNADLQGKVIVLDFWATWCVPCIASFPRLNSLVREFDKNSDIIFLSITDESKEYVEQFLERRNIELSAYKLIDTNKTTFSSYEIDGRPQTFVIDKSGIIRWIGRMEDLKPEMLSTLVDHRDNIIPSTFSKKLVDSRAGMHFYINNVTDGGGGHSSYYDSKLKYWKFNTDGSNIADIIRAIARPRLEADVEFLNEEKIKSRNYSLRFRLDTTMMSAAQRQDMRNRTLLNSIHENYLIELLKGCGVSTVIREEERTVYFLEVEDVSKLSPNLSQATHIFSLTRMPEKSSVEFQNILLSQIADISTVLGIVIRDNTNEKKRYNLKLDGTDLESLTASLGKYGIRLKKRKGLVRILQVNFSDK